MEQWIILGCFILSLRYLYTSLFKKKSCSCDSKGRCPGTCSNLSVTFENCRYYDRK